MAAPSMEALQSLASEFLKTYYATISNNRANMLSFYTDQSVMSYENDHYVGLEKIKHKIESFSFTKVQIPSER
jgi:Nuclear transport factor 2 (NTF2) domain